MKLLSRSRSGVILVTAGLLAAGIYPGQVSARTPDEARPPGDAGAEGRLAALRGWFPSVFAGAEGARAAPARLRLGAPSGQGFSLHEPGGLGVDVALAGAAAARGERLGGVLLYPGAGPGGADVIHRIGADRVEDFIAFWGAPQAPEVRYDVRLDGVAGLRHVGGVLELLDDRGTPRLRVSPPYLIDASGRRHAAALAVEGCAVDTSPAPPWGRPTTPPGSGSCALRVSWAGAAVAYPALLDPAWVDTNGNGVGVVMADDTTGHALHAVAVLHDGKILVIGGASDLSSPASLVPTAVTEVFDPDTRTFSPTGALATARYGHTATTLSTGEVLVVGGIDAGQQPLATVEAYSPATGLWTTATAGTPAMGASRAFHTATLLPDSGRLLVAGGHGSQGGGPAATLASAEIFDPFTRKWNGAGAMKTARRNHTATTTASGQILLAGGLSGGGGLAKAELHDPKAPPNQQWAAPEITLNNDRSKHGAALMRDGSVVLAGGCGGEGSSYLGCLNPRPGAEYIPPGATKAIPVPGAMDGNTWGHAVLGLFNGSLLAAGWQIDPANNGNVDQAVFVLSGSPAEPLSKWTWGKTLDPMKVKRFQAVGALTPAGSVLIAGGRSKTTALASADFLPFKADGAPCPAGTEIDCASGVCSGGICCDRPCGGPCESCKQSETGLPDGTCAPIPEGKPGACADQGLASCGTRSACDGKGACKTYLGAEGCHANPVCLGNKADLGVCTGAASCTTKLQDCGYFKCEDGVGCKTTCATEADCNGAFCVAGQCSPQFANGELCDQDVACQSGHCELASKTETRCCAQDCSPRFCDTKGTGSVLYYPCEGGVSCKATPSFLAYCDGYACQNGQCLATCSDDQDCAKTHFCDVTTCRKKNDSGVACTSGAQCESGFCADGVCCNQPCDDACVACAKTFTGGPDGMCLAVQAGNAHKGECQDTAECRHTGACNGLGSCQFQAAGTLCNKAAQGCNADRTSQLIHKCNGDGLCNTFTESVDCGSFLCDTTAKECKTSCASDQDCDGSSGCVSSKCKPRAPTRCEQGAVVFQACDGAACSPEVLAPCGGYACKASACLSSCKSNDDCDKGRNCNTITGQCAASDVCNTDGVSYQTATGEQVACRSGQRCSDARPASCAEPCQSAADCVANLVCRSDGVCAPPPAPSSDSADCLCSAPGRPAAPAAPAGAALALALLAASARRRKPGVRRAG